MSSSAGLSLPLEGTRVRLEPLAPRHEEPLWAAARDRRVWRYMRTRGGDSREDFGEWLAWAYAETIPYATLLDGVPVGSTSYLNVREGDRVVEIGNTWLAPAAWGTGANDEAKLLMLEHALERCGFLRVEFKTEAANERSRAALAAIGATFEGVFRRHMLVRGGERRDSAWFSVIDEDWPAVKAGLVARVEARTGAAR